MKVVFKVLAFIFYAFVIVEVLYLLSLALEEGAKDIIGA